MPACKENDVGMSIVYKKQVLEETKDLKKILKGGIR